MSPLTRRSGTSTRDSEFNVKQFRKTYTQPILIAVQEELPEVVLKLLDAGADVNTLNPLGWQTLNKDTGYQPNQVPSTLLDAVQRKMNHMRHFLETGQVKNDDPYRRTYVSPPPTAPIPLKEDAEYLKDFDSDSYAYWSAQVQIENARENYERDLKRFEETSKNQDDKEGVDEKKNAIKALLTEYEILQSKLRERDAKTFKELYPDLKFDEPQQQEYNTPDPVTPEPWKPKVTFQLPDMTDTRRDAYVKLLQACWVGDLSTIKQFCLAIWGDENQTPLNIAVRDVNNFLTIFRRHPSQALRCRKGYSRDCSCTIFSPKRSRVKLNIASSPQTPMTLIPTMAITKAFIFTLKSWMIASQLKTSAKCKSQVKSKVTPLQFLSWPCPVSRFFTEERDPSIPETTGYSQQSV